jgi:hypothetical protein
MSETKAEPKQSDTLKAFYQDIQKWIDRGTPAHRFYLRDSGLCKNNERYHLSIGSPYSNLIELKDQFEKAGLDRMFPFNVSADKGYFYEHKDRTIFDNEERLKWVKDHAK